MKHQVHLRHMEELHIKGVLELGLALMMGRIVMLWPFYGLSSSVRTLDPALKEARIRAARERIEDLEGRQQALRPEQQELIVLVIEYEHKGN
ncbi:hypothetical protein Tco_0485237 [Tanacetum coccineum]